MIQSILVYNSLLFILPSLGDIAVKSYERKPYPYYTNYWLSLILIIFIFTLIFGIREGVGIDFYAYKDKYELFLKGLETHATNESGFLLICRFLALWSLPSPFFFSFFCFIQILFIVRAFRKSNLLPYILVVLMMSQFMIMMTLVRQMTFVCIYIWLVKKIEKFNFFQYALIIIICTFFFHKSAFLTLALYPFIKYQHNLCGNSIFQIIIFTIFVYIGYSQILIHSFENLDFIANALGYEQYSGYNVLSGMFMDPNWGPRTYIRLFLMYAAILFSNKVRKHNEGAEFNRYYNLFFWGVCFEMMLYGTNVASRAFLPLYYMKLVIYAYTLQFFYLKFKRKKKLLGLSLFGILLLMDYLTVFYEVQDPDKTVAYNFCWQIN